MAITKNCVICGKQFRRRGKRAIVAKYCSHDCYHMSRRKRVVKTCVFCDKKFERRDCEIKKNKSGKFFCSRECAFKVMVPSTAYKKGQFAGKKHRFYGKKRPEMTGKNNSQWKGGITPINQAIRNSFRYEEWRKAVFERDLYTCQNCDEIGGKLNADHIKPFALYPELRFDVKNGRTLCEKCHKDKTIQDWKKYSFYGNKKYKYQAI